MVPLISCCRFTCWLCITCHQSFSYVLFEFHSCKLRLTPQYNILFLLKREKLTWGWVFLFVSLQMFLLYSYLKSTLTILRKLISQELKIKIFKLHFLLLWEFCKKDILPVAATFCMRLKKWFTRFKNLEFLPKLNVPKFAN